MVYKTASRSNFDVHGCNIELVFAYIIVCLTMVQVVTYRMLHNIPKSNSTTLKVAIIAIWHCIVPVLLDIMESSPFDLSCVYVQ